MASKRAGPRIEDSRRKLAVPEEVQTELPDAHHFRIQPPLHLTNKGSCCVEYVDGGVSTVYLKENYRSTSNIVSAAEKVIAAAGKDDDLRRAMTPQRGSGPSPRIIACADEAAEANFVVDTVFDLLNDGSIGDKSSVAVIYRTNAQSRHLEEACVNKNLPYTVRGGAGGFYNRAEVKDCLCFLRLLRNGNDDSALIRALKTPSRGLGDKALVEFREYCDVVDKYYQQELPGKKRPTRLEVLLALADVDFGTHSLDPNVPLASDTISKRAMNNFLPFSRQMRGIRDQAFKLPLDALLFHIVEELQLWKHFDAISKSKSEFQGRKENVQELRTAMEKYSKNGAALELQNAGTALEDTPESETSLSTFLDDVALVSDIADAESGSDDGHLVVNLMTIHASKGMEFDVVFVVGNEEGTLPGAMSLQEGEDSVALQEERRLCYVAMTRAKTRLILTWRKEVTAFSSWSKGGGAKTTTKTRSRFLDVLVANKSKGKPKTKSSAPLRRPNATTSRESANTPSVSTPRSRPLVKRPGKVSDIGSSRRVTTQTATQRRRPTSAPSKNFEDCGLLYFDSILSGYGVRFALDREERGRGRSKALRLYDNNYERVLDYTGFATGSPNEAPSRRAPLGWRKSKFEGPKKPQSFMEDLFGKAPPQRRESDTEAEHSEDQVVLKEDAVPSLSRIEWVPAVEDVLTWMPPTPQLLGDATLLLLRLTLNGTVSTQNYRWENLRNSWSALFTAQQKYGGNRETFEFYPLVCIAASLLAPPQRVGTLFGPEERLARALHKMGELLDLGDISVPDVEDGEGEEETGYLSTVLFKDIVADKEPDFWLPIQNEQKKDEWRLVFKLLSSSIDGVYDPSAEDEFDVLQAELSTGVQSWDFDIRPFLEHALVYAACKCGDDETLSTARSICSRGVTLRPNSPEEWWRYSIVLGLLGDEVASENAHQASLAFGGGQGARRDD